MTDRELLELAAKAAGYGLPGPDDHDELGRQELDGLWVKFPWGWGWWRPLFNDGATLRLAVTLGIEFASFNGSKVSRSRVLDMTGSDIFEPHGIDPYSATRRVIVRAAAEIGKDMK